MGNQHPPPHRPSVRGGRGGDGECRREDPGAARTVGGEHRGRAGHYEPDNSWFKILLELGVLGLWFFALVIAGIFTSIHQAAKRLEGVDAAFLRGVAAMVAAAIAAAFVSSYFDLFPMDMYFWLLVGVAATIGASGSEDRAGPSRAPTQWERVRA